MRPSKTRFERQNPTSNYLSDLELKQALQIQAAEKKKALHLMQLQEKADLLKHYENYALGNQNSTDDDLREFIEQKKGEFEGYNEEIQEANELITRKPEFLNRKNHNFDSKDYENVNNMVSLDKKDDGLSNGEIERQKRLKLREEERMRRLHGIKSSAYDENGGLTFEQKQIIQYTENKRENPQIKNDIFGVNENNKARKKNAPFNFQSYGENENQNINNKPSERIKQSVPIEENQEEFYEHKSEYQKENPDIFQKPKALEKKMVVQHEKMILKEKQQHYKDELDKQLAQKQMEQERMKKPRPVSNIEDFRPNINPNNFRNDFHNNNYPFASPQNQDSYGNNDNFNEYKPDIRKDRPKTVVEIERNHVIDKKKQYAEELRLQINEKKNEKVNIKQIMTPANNISTPQSNVDNSILKKRELQKKYREELNSQIQQKNFQKVQPKQDLYNQQDGNNNYNYNEGKKGMFVSQNPTHNKYEENESYRPLREEGFRIVKEESYKPIADNGYSQNREEDYQPVKEAAGGISNWNYESNNRKTPKYNEKDEKSQAFLTKLEDEYKSRENKRKDMKQFYQEELKKQIEEKKRIKEQEEMKLKEEEKRELERIEREKQELMLQEENKDGFKQRGGRKPLTSILAAQKEENTISNDIPRQNVQNNLQKNEDNEPYIEEAPKNYGFNHNNMEDRNRNQPIFVQDDPRVFQETQELRDSGGFYPKKMIKHSSSERYVTYEEFEKQTKALKDAIEEKLLTEKLNHSQEAILNNYKEKIKDIMEEKRKHEEEIEKLKKILEIYSCEKQVDLDFLNNALQNQENPSIRQESVKILENMQNHLRESMHILDSLPARSNFVYDNNNFEQSFIKDLAIFHAIQKNYFLNESQSIDRALEENEKNPLNVKQTSLNEEIFREEDKFHVPITKPQSQKRDKARMFQSLIRSSRAEADSMNKKEESFEKLVVSENVASIENPNLLRERNKIMQEDNLKKLLMEDSEAQSYYINSHNLDDRKFPAEDPKRQINEEELYENEGFDSDELEENEIQMEEAKFKNEEKSLVLADEELDEGTVERFIESSESNMYDMKLASKSKDFYMSSNSKMGKFRKPKTVDVFGKLQNTNSTFEKNEEKNLKNNGRNFNKNEKALNRIENYLDELEQEDSKW